MSETAPKVSFTVTTYWKRPRGQPGLTRMGSRRLTLSEALDWVLAELPADAVTLAHDLDDGRNVVTVTIDWGKVPMEARDGAR
jgi:hypothetical protein